MREGIWSLVKGFTVLVADEPTSNVYKFNASPTMWKCNFLSQVNQGQLHVIETWPNFAEQDLAAGDKQVTDLQLNLSCWVHLICLLYKVAAIFTTW